MATQNDWTKTALGATNAEHAKETASLKQQLDHALAQLERLEKTKRAKIIAAKPARKETAAILCALSYPIRTEPRPTLALWPSYWRISRL